MKFLSAGMGVSGGNFLVADTGSVVLVTNEGNGRMGTVLPRVHLAVVGIEKVIPRMADLPTFLRLLPRSASGQTISSYVSIVTGRGAGGTPRGRSGCTSSCSIAAAARSSRGSTGRS